MENVTKQGLWLNGAQELIGNKFIFKILSVLNIGLTRLFFNLEFLHLKRETA